MAARSRRSLAAINNGNKPYIGRRTGKVIEINARLDKFGFERVSDYFPDTDSESEDEIPQNPDDDENINDSKLNKSKHNDSSRASSSEQIKSRNEPASEKSLNGSEISPDSAVGSADSEIPSPKIDTNEAKEVSSSEKQVSSPEKQVSSPEKQISSPRKESFSPDKPVPPSDKQVLSTMRRDNSMPQANVSGMSIMVHSSPEEDTNPGSTRKKLRFSMANTSLVREETRLDIEQSLITANETKDPTQDDYVITDSRKDARPKTHKTTTKNTKQRRNSHEYRENIEELLTQEVCKSNHNTFLTLKNKPNNTIRDMLYKSTNSKISTTLDIPESSQLSSNNAAVSKNSQPSPKDRTVTNRSQKSPENETIVSTNAPTTQKANRSKIPVRKKKGPKLTFQFRPSRKSSPKTQKWSDATTPQKGRYRKTPGAKNGVRKASTGDADTGDADTQPESQIAKPSLGKRSTRSTKPQEFSRKENIESESEESAEPPVKKPTRKGQPSTKKSSKVPVSNRLANRMKTPIANQDSHDIEESDKNPKETTTKIARSKKNAAVNDVTESSNVEVPGLQSIKPDKSESRLDSSAASQRVQSSVNSVQESAISKRRSRKRPGLFCQNELESEVNLESTVKAPISSRTSTTKNSDENSERSSGSSSDNEATASGVENSERSSGNSSDDEATASGVEVFHNTAGSPVSTMRSEAEGGVSSIKAPRNRKRRAAKLDSVTATINVEVGGNVDVALRRSQRTRVPCLQYWKNERIEYERRLSGLVVKDIIVNPTPAPTRRKRRADCKPMKPQSKKATRGKNSTEDESDWSDIEIPDGMTKEADPVATVVDPDTMQEVKMKLIHSGKDLNLRSPTSSRDESSLIDAPLLLDKYFSQSKFGAGEILLRPGAEKGRQHVRRDTMIFHLHSGHVLFSVHNQSFIASKGSTFFVPQGNVYNLKNLDTKKDARLSFYQIKE